VRLVVFIAYIIIISVIFISLALQLQVCLINSVQFNRSTRQNKKRSEVEPGVSGF